MVSMIKQSGGASLVLLLLALFAVLATATPVAAPQLPQFDQQQQMGTTEELDLAAQPKPPIQAPSPENGGATIDQDTGQVTIKKPPGDNATVTLPIQATIYHGVPGPKNCRGRPMGVVELPGPGKALASQGERCYDLAETANCGVFISNKADGCEARLFSDPGCRTENFVNIVVFMPEHRAVGGVWRSMGIRCGVPEPDPATLGEPPLAQYMKQTPKKPKGGKGPGVIPVQPTT
ncbi:hypothetical protein MCOR25_001294 [Pyricularia grisea]|uniref:Uncharacterized protein n=1 Tax=Pyricularia grisea TaxID=148305 RepID=A0A6P8BNL0_PYRGI|nr:uncharacterized protein PgNI_00699 [Pyricularia grisea]KAI6381362.1 hypothetical protein MCOR25_001294 [Pyricularia grisea]TLD17922.1 hypothetical protein PgNI_00699 [Pyricularia grisea]